MAKPNELIVEIRPNITFSVEVAGEGEPLIFLHGAQGLEWDPFLDELSDKYRVYAPHLPGTGNSVGLEHIDGIWDLTLCYYELFDMLEIESANVIGYSLGGMFAAEIAANDQSRVKSLSLICPTGLWLDSHPIPDIFAMLPNELTELIVNDQESSLAQMVSERASSTDLDLKIKRIENLKAAGKFLWPIPDKGLSKRIHRIKVPTSIIWGKEDKLVPFVYGDEFNKAIATSELFVVEDASHLVYLEQQEKVLTIIDNFQKTKNSLKV